ncbi:NIPSNAP family protein [Paraburkholderia sp. BL25I1N1]|uniref:NIPSNAP family protein n=1 Tax=Paraburkholderia sp. BL25I1N1 TaxID=1938804 RepID=UPI000D0588D1|nr:NIPSNAP family protein [Paraburkholderia sp. BL25I1N1]PRY05954.1 NIPSNAP protein [Paraburkholderia sp. BL25I1N1]
MIVEMRTYTFQPGKLREWLPYFEKERFPIQQKHLGKLLGYYTADTGELNQVVQLWAYETFEDRAARRAALWSDPEWLNPSKSTMHMIVKQESKLLLPTAFSPKV